MKDRTPVTPHSSAGPLVDPPSDLPVEVLALRFVHRNVARERVQKRDVLLGAVRGLPDVAPDLDIRKDPAGLDLRRPRREPPPAEAAATRPDGSRRSRRRPPGFRRRRGQSLWGRRAGRSRTPSDLPGGAADAPSGSALPGRSSARRSRRRRGRMCQARLPGLRMGQRESRLAIRRDCCAPVRRAVRRSRRRRWRSRAGAWIGWPCPCAADLEEPVARLERSELDEVVEELVGVRGSRRVVEASRGVECAPERLARVAHRPIVRQAGWLEND